MDCPCLKLTAYVVIRDRDANGIFFGFVMLNWFQHPWPILSFRAALHSRADHGP
jgi:hypothetical protein